MHWFGIAAGVLIIALDLIFFMNNEKMMLFLMGIALGVGALPFVVAVMIENKKEENMNEMFLEFTRNLAEAVSAGTPVSRSIVNMRHKGYGSLGPYVKKLANQIDLGVPVDKAFATFANDTGSSMIKRAVELIKEAEKAGGEIDYILDSTAKAISEIEKLKKERRAAIYSLVVQGYIIFFIFIGIILVVQFKILPLTEGISGFNEFSADLDALENPVEGGSLNTEELTRPFLYLLLTQGLFVGLVIGKLTEGKLKSGIKHSFVLMITAFLISTGASLFGG